jgi:hypothetical protein
MGRGATDRHATTTVTWQLSTRSPVAAGSSHHVHSPCRSPGLPQSENLGCAWRRRSVIDQSLTVELSPIALGVPFGPERSRPADVAPGAPD